MLAQIVAEEWIFYDVERRPLLIDFNVELDLDNPEDKHHIIVYYCKINLLASPVNTESPSVSEVAKRLAAATKIRRI